MPLSQAQKLAALHLSNGLRSVVVAEKINVTQQTICSWKKSAEFKAHLNSLIGAMQDDSRRRAVALQDRAWCELEDILSGGSDSARLQAIKLIMQLNGGLLGPQDSRARYRDLRGAVTLEGVKANEEEDLSVDKMGVMTARSYGLKI